LNAKYKKKLAGLVSRFTSGRVLVVGDVMLDQFVYGSVERISPEAPVPVVKVDRETFRLGGAANVAANLAALGANVSLCGMIGGGVWGEEVVRLCDEGKIATDGLLKNLRARTTLKTRVIAHHQQVVRFDRESKSPLSPAMAKKLLAVIERLIESHDAIIVSDYGKGLVGKTLLDALRAAKKKRGLVVAVDPKIENVRHYKGMSIITPNQHEAGQMLGRKVVNQDGPVEIAGRALLRKLSLDSLLITRGEGGMSLFVGKDRREHIPTRAQQVFDVTGAGDTVIATLTLAMACGATVIEAAEIANFAAGIVVGKLGTAVTSSKELKQAITRGGA
jgi:rfaE bifunctional protein kinase chain/domain